MKYSSCPNLIKHYVPMSFSCGTLDYQGQLKNVIKPVDENPFRNQKLQNLHEKPKDFVLIFKNKTCKDFCAKKKVKYSHFINQMRNIQSDSDNIQAYTNCQNNKLQLLRPKSIVSSRNKFRIEQRQIKTPASLRKFINNGYSTARQTRCTWKSGKSGKSGKQNTSNQFENEEEQIDCLLTLKIQGSRAPNSQMVDHFKRYSIDGRYYLISKLVK